ncbi:MAG: hypothetical protein JYX80_06145 [Candidatus Scalindua sediminis]|nr:hypothetical protein [Candidatus Scalindua sediminis]
MDKITTEELDNLETEELVSRMDEALSSPYWSRMGNKILKLNVCSLYESATVKKFDPVFQRKVAYKSFGFLLQLQYSELSSSANFFRLPEKDENGAKQIYWAARNQWTIVSSRMAFEYFMHLTYMLGSGSDFKSGKSAIKKFKNWLKERENPYSYFTISAARAMQFDRSKRSPEVHATTKLVRRILLMTASDIDNDVFQLINILKNQWQFILDIAHQREPNGWVSCGNVDDDKEWYGIWESKDYDAISKKIDEVFVNYEN